MTNTLNIALIGTSLITSPKDRGWFYLLRNYMQTGSNKRINVYSRGLSGGRSDWGLTVIPSVVDLRPDIYIIEFINDANPNDGGFSVNQSVANFRTMVEIIQSDQANAVIYIMALVRPRADGEAEFFPNLHAMDEAHKSLAEELNIGFIDTRTPWGDPSLHPDEFAPDDGVHPLLNGYVRVVLPTVAATLSQFL